MVGAHSVFRPFASLCIGVLLGPAALDVIDLSALQEDPGLLENTARITLSFAPSGVAMRDGLLVLASGHIAAKLVRVTRDRDLFPE